jgi:hypothetical protein
MGWDRGTALWAGPLARVCQTQGHMFMSLVKHATLLGGIQIPTCWGATFLNSKSLAVKASTGVWDCVLAVATSVVT